MIDLGQAIPRPNLPPLAYTWGMVKMNGHERGTICVIRQSSGSPEVLAISPQWHWVEWSGAFSVI